MKSCKLCKSEAESSRGYGREMRYVAEDHPDFAYGDVRGAMSVHPDTSVNGLCPHHRALVKDARRQSEDFWRYVKTASRRIVLNELGLSPKIHVIVQRLVDAIRTDPATAGTKKAYRDAVKLINTIEERWGDANC